VGVYQNGSAVLIRETFGVETIPGDFSTFVPTDPTTVTFSLRNPYGAVTTYVFGVDAELTNPSVGVYILDPGPLDIAGVWPYRAAGTGDVVATIEGELTILPSSVLDPISAEPVYGPCQVWCDPQDIVACCGSEFTSDTSVLEDAATAATQLLYQLSGRQFNGLCTQTVRPCAEGCGCWPYALLPGLSVGAPQYPVGAGGWGPWGFWGTGWGWGGDSCGCTPLSRALLPGYPIVSITEVKIDGVVLNSDEYRLDERRWLTRMADPENGKAQWWPGCQRLDRPDDDPNTWSASYVYGMTVPELGRQAAAQLGCEIYKFCSGGECATPANTIQKTRQGVTVQLAPFISWGRKSGQWVTGMSLVDMFLSSFNPSGLRRRPSIWSPDGVPYARIVGS
jgi:hypothetical protein